MFLYKRNFYPKRGKHICVTLRSVVTSLVTPGGGGLMKDAARAPGHRGVSHSPPPEPLRHPDCPQLSHRPQHNKYSPGPVEFIKQS